MSPKVPVFFALLTFALALTAFQNSPVTPSLSKKDTILFIVPSNFPKPVYSFKNNPLTKKGFLLGKSLFYDPILSSDRSVSCSSCHQASAAFANLGLAFSAGVKGCVGKRNAPPLFNLAWQKGLMWDGRIPTIHDVPLNAITNPCEMANTMDSVVVHLQSDSNYPLLFREVFGTRAITSDQVLKALAQFTSMMISANSKYDKHQRLEPGGDFTSDEQSGYHLFKEKCSSCHTEPLFTDGSYRNNGLDEVSIDIGRDSITHTKSDRGKFRVPSLRNVEITKPYMHDGRFSSLKQVLQHYNSGVKNHVNLDPVFKKNINPGIALSQIQQSQIIAFLKTLTDVDFINDRRFVNH